MSASSPASPRPGCTNARRSASLLLVGGIAVYAAVGALIHLRNLPSIVVTLGMSFVWLGLAVLVLPTPGGKSPEWLAWLMKLKPPLVPFPIIAAVVDRRRSRMVRADAHLLRLDPARLRRQSEGDRARRLVAAEDQGDDVRAGRLLRHARRAVADRPHHLGRRQYRASATRSIRSPASSSAAASSSAGACRRSARCIGAHDAGARRRRSSPSCTSRPTGRSARRARS